MTGKYLIPFLALFLIGASGVVNRDYYDFTKDGNCIAYFSFDDDLSDRSLDEAGNNFILNKGNTPDYGSFNCHENNCWDFNGTDEYFAESGANELIDSATELSGCAWVYHDGVADDDSIMAKQDDGFADGFWFWRDEAGTSRNNTYTAYFAENGTADSCRVEGEDGISIQSTLIHVCFTFSGGSDARLYVNGIEDQNSPGDCSSVATIDSGTEKFYIGRHEAAGKYFDGKIDSAILLSRVLTASEIKQIYLYGLK